MAAGWLVARSHPEAILRSLRTALPGIILAAFIHVFAMLASARIWESLLPRASRPSLRGMLYLVWIRESINGLLPVARIGGEIVSFRLLRWRAVRAPAAAASLVVDIQIFVIAQFIWTLVSVAFLLGRADSSAVRLAGELLWGVGLLGPLVLVWILVQRARPLERLVRHINRFAGGKLTGLVGQTARVDRHVRAIWRRRGTLVACLVVWQPLQFLVVSLELWVALQFLGSPLSFPRTLALEALVQAVATAAFFVPAGLGVQEGGFVLIGGALGLSAEACLALAGARRLRDLIVFLPGLAAWQLAEKPTTP